MTAAIGHNSSAFFEDDDIPGLRGPHQLDERLVRLAWRTLQIICIIFSEDPHTIAGKRNPVRQLLIRKVWYAVMKPHFEPDPIILEKLQDVREQVSELDEEDPRYKPLKAQQRALREEARGKVWMLAAMAGLDRGTVCDDQNDVDKWCNRNTRLDELLSMMRDMAEPLPALLDDKDDFLYELSEEREQDARDRKKVQESLARIKDARRALEGKPRLVVSNVGSARKSA